MNKELLLKVKERILANPKDFDMSKIQCGTVGCIAGHALFLEGIIFIDFEFTGWESMACNALDISRDDGEQLFHDSHWPDEELMCDYASAEEARDHPEMARIAAKVIDNFIAERTANE